MMYLGEGILAVLYCLTIEHHAHRVYNSLKHKGGLSKKDSTGLSDILVVVDELSAHQLSVDWIVTHGAKRVRHIKLLKEPF